MTVQAGRRQRRQAGTRCRIGGELCVEQVVLIHTEPPWGHREGHRVTTEKCVAWLFLSNAVINWVISIPGMLSPEFAAATFGGPAPNHPSVVRLWQGVVFMFGWVFLEAGPRRRGQGGTAEIQLDQEDDHGQRTDRWLCERRCPTAPDAADCVHELAVESPDHVGRLRGSAAVTARGPLPPCAEGGRA